MGVGRFVNADDCSVIEGGWNIQIKNLYAYCENDPANGTDATGALLGKKIAEIFLSAVFGFVYQMLVDFALYLVKKLVNAEKDAHFDPDPGDYVEQSLDWALDYLSIFSKKKKIIACFIKDVLLSIINQITNLIAGYKFDLLSIFKDSLVAAAKAALKKCLGKKTSKEISKLKKHHFKNKKMINSKDLKINLNFKVLGKKFKLSIMIPRKVTDFLEKVLF